MTVWARPEYTGVTELRGPLLVVRGVDGVGWDEFAAIRTETGQTRHGLVLEADRDLAVVQVLEGTGGMRTTSARVAACCCRAGPCPSAARSRWCSRGPSRSID